MVSVEASCTLSHVQLHGLLFSWSQVVVKKTTASLELKGDATFGDLMKQLSANHGIDVAKPPGCKIKRFPASLQAP